MDWAREQSWAPKRRSSPAIISDNPASGNVLRKLGFVVHRATQDLFGLARQARRPPQRYVWPEGASPELISWTTTKRASPHTH